MLRLPQTFAGQDEYMEELLGDEYYVDLFAEIADSEPITEAIDEVRQCQSSRVSVLCTATGDSGTPLLMMWKSCIDYLSSRFRVQAHQKARDKRTASATTV